MTLFRSFLYAGEAATVAIAWVLAGALGRWLWEKAR